MYWFLASPASNVTRFPDEYLHISIESIFNLILKLCRNKNFFLHTFKILNILLYVKQIFYL